MDIRISDRDIKNGHYDVYDKLGRVARIRGEIGNQCVIWEPLFDLETVENIPSTIEAINVVLRYWIREE